MKKYIIIAAVFTACLALCAAVWPQTTTTEEIPAAPSPPTVTVTQPETLKAPEIEELIAPERENTKSPHLEAAHDIVSEPEPAPDPIPTVPETQVIAEPEPEPADAPVASVIQPTPEPQSTPTPAPSQAAIAPQPGDMVYVPGFGWLEYQGPGEVIYDTEIYENGNKIGSMG